MAWCRRGHGTSWGPKLKFLGYPPATDSDWSSGVPSLPPRAAYLVSGFLAFSYVAILYILPAARSRPWEKDPITGQPRDRQNPAVIRARLFAAILITLLSLLGMACLVNVYGGIRHNAHPIRTTLHLTGLLPSGTVALSSQLTLLLQPFLLTATLFLGPTYALLLQASSSLPSQREAKSFDWLDLQTLRNLVVGPVSEEIVFRGCIIATYLLIDPLVRPSAAQIIFLSPLWFGAAHLHSLRETYVSNGRTRNALLSGCLIAAFQFAYTTIFGWYAAFVHVRTGSVMAASLCHSFCNFMGVPPLMKSLREFPNRRLHIGISYALGIILFTLGVQAWATNPHAFPSSNPLWNDLK